MVMAMPVMVTMMVVGGGLFESVLLLMGYGFGFGLII